MQTYQRTELETELIKRLVELTERVEWAECAKGDNMLQSSARRARNLLDRIED